MTKMNSMLLKKNSEISKREMTSIAGGANNSDVYYVDTKLKAGKYDIATQSLLDIIETTNANDKPATAI